VVERHRFLTLVGEVFVEHVEHLQERHVRRDTLTLVGHEAPGALGVLLAPDLQGDLHL